MTRRHGAEHRPAVTASLCTLAHANKQTFPTTKPNENDSLWPFVEGNRVALRRVIWSQLVKHRRWALDPWSLRALSDTFWRASTSDVNISTR